MGEAGSSNIPLAAVDGDASDLVDGEQRSVTHGSCRRKGEVGVPEVEVLKRPSHSPTIKEIIISAARSTTATNLMQYIKQKLHLGF